MFFFSYVWLSFSVSKLYIMISQQNTLKRAKQRKQRQIQKQLHWTIQCTALFELESLTNTDLFIQKCLCVQYPRRKTSERACGGSMGLLLAIKARFDLCLPLGSASALG